MSAFLCSDLHILTVAACIKDATDVNLSVHDVFAIADELRRENVRSVNYRYNERSRHPKGWTVDAVKISNLANVDRLALIDCLDYQSCERPDYEKSHAGKMLKSAHAYYQSLTPSWAKSNVWSI